MQKSPPSINCRDIFLISFVFSIFLSIRIIAWILSIPSIVVYGDAYAYYVPAGIAYVNGELPVAVNPEHPPLAKYIIGLFAVYLHSPNLASVVFSLLLAIPVFLLARKLMSGTNWALVSVWLLAFDLINISISIHPILEVFMLFFAFLGIYFIVTAGNGFHYALAGLMLGFAIASKWIAIFFILPALMFILLRRNYIEALVVLATGIGSYLLTYSPFILTEGLGSFLRLQSWMMQFMLRLHAPESGTFFSGLISSFIFQATTFGRVSDYSRPLHPEGFRFLDSNYISFADVTTPFITLLLYPLLFWQIRKYYYDRRQTRLFMLFILLSLEVWLISLGNVPLELWFYSPVTVLLSIFAADFLNDFHKRGKTEKKLAYLYLIFVGTWLFYASSIQALRIAHYWGII